MENTAKIFFNPFIKSLFIRTSVCPKLHSSEVWQLPRRKIPHSSLDASINMKRVYQKNDHFWNEFYTLLDRRSLGVTPKCTFFTLKPHTKQLLNLLVIFCDMLEASLPTHGRMEGQTVDTHGNSYLDIDQGSKIITKHIKFPQHFGLVLAKRKCVISHFRHIFHH